MIKLALVHTFHGPSPYGQTPVVVFDLWAEDGFAFDEAQARQALETHYPDWVDGPAEGDDAELALASLAAGWALGALNEVRGFLHDAGTRREDDKLRVWLGFHEPWVSIAALRLAVRAVLNAGQESFDAPTIAAELEHLWQAVGGHHPDSQARILLDGARVMGIPVLQFMPGVKLWQYGWGARGRTFMETASNADGYLGYLWQRDKAVTKDLLALLGMPIAPHALVKDEADLDRAVRDIGYPCVIKPLACGSGKGVTAGIRDRVALGAAFAFARQYSADPIMLEAHVPGEDHRLMVIHGRLVAAVRREPSVVVGDGKRTVAELVAQVNAPRSHNMVRSGYLVPIAFDRVLADHLGTQGAALGDVLPRGRRVTLRSNANRSTGGLSTDVTEAVHPAVRAMAEQLAETIGLASAGIDYLTTDIALPPEQSGGIVIEANFTPGLDVCLAAGVDALALTRLVFGEDVGAIPVELIVHTAGALGERLEALRSGAMPPGEGWVCGTEVRIGDAALHVQTTEPWGAVKAAVRNRGLERLRIECSDEDIMRDGLPLAYFERVEFEGVKLPEEWDATIARALA